MRRLAGQLRDWVERFEAAGLELRELTALLPLRPLPAAEREQLHVALRALDSAEPSPLASVPGLHQARFALLEDHKLHANETAPCFPLGPLIFQCVYEGDREDLLFELFERCGEPLDAVLGHCRGYPGSRHGRACVEQLLAAVVPSGFFFRDRSESRPEIQRALALRRSFVDFVAAMGGASEAELKHAFERFRAGQWSLGPEPASDLRLDYGYALLRPLERPIPHERYWARRAATLARARARRTTREARLTDPTAPAVRGVHAKHHGLLRADFVVRSDVPAELRHGVFSHPGRHAAWIRLSNASDRIQHDDVPDARGLAIKVELDDPAAFGQPLDVGLPGATGRRAFEQDFVLVSHPTFFVKDIHEYAVFRSILDLRDRRELALRLAVFGARRPRQAAIFARSLLRRIDDALAIEYHSMTASALGPAQAVKYLVRPASRARDASSRLGLVRRWLAKRPPDHLRDSLAHALDPRHGSARRLELCLIVPAVARLPVEDPTHDWRDAGARCIPVATLEIDPQPLGSDEQARRAENLVFTPWHTLQEHRPLGSLNRARLEVYRASAAERHAQNGVTDAARGATILGRPSLQARGTRAPETQRRRSRELS